MKNSWDKKHPKKVAAIKRAYYERNKEAAKARASEWNKANKERRKEICKKSDKKHPENRVNVQNRRRERMISNRDSSSKEIVIYMRRIRKKGTAKCYYCLRKISGSRIHFDHIIPLAKGGRHSISNICVSCDTCNFSKNAKHLGEWHKIDQPLLILS